MKFELWYLVMGALLVAIALVSSVVKRLPLTTTMLYLGVGILLGPMVAGVAKVDPFEDVGWLERVAEFGVLVSLFTAGLKLRVPLRFKEWSVPLRLAFLSMVLTVGMVTMAGVWWLGLPLGAAVLLGAILAPTDPVLASEVQLESAADRDRLRFSLTGEASLNDGTAFPFVMLGLGLLGLHELGDGGWKWIAVDVLWSVIGGLGIGAILGAGVGQLVLYFRQKHRESFGLDEFLTLGLIGLSYGLALLAHTYGFLAVFAAGLALRHVERKHTGDEPPDVVAIAALGKKEEIATHPKKSAAYLAEAVLGFNEQIERILEVALVLIVGLMLAPAFLDLNHLLFVPFLLLVVRPLSVWLGLLGCRVEREQRLMLSWFGIRGIGSLFYLFFIIRKEVPAEIASNLLSVTLWCIATSVVVHGISVTSLMKWYRSRVRYDDEKGSRRKLAPAHSGR
ncbi:MAG TPA: cation:proton antiporter [Verrucomicrobiae bacterium]